MEILVFTINVPWTTFPHVHLITRKRLHEIS